MAERIIIYDGDEEAGRLRFRYSVAITAHDDRLSFDVEHGLHSVSGLDEDDGVDAKITLRAQNPLIESGIVVVAIKAWGLCVGTRLVRFTAVTGRDIYGQHREVFPDADLFEALGDTVKEMSRRGEEFSAQARKVAVGCIPFRSWFRSRDESPPPGPEEL